MVAAFQTLEGLGGLRLSVPPQTKALPDNYSSIQYKRGEYCLKKSELILEDVGFPVPGVFIMGLATLPGIHRKSRGKDMVMTSRPSPYNSGIT